MTTFKNDLESTVSQTGKLDIPIELHDANLMDRLGISYQALMATPAHVIDEIAFLWFLQNVRQKALDRIASKKSNSG